MEEIFARLSTLGLHTPPSMTPTERMKWLVSAGVLSQEHAERLLQCYHASRFGKEPTTPKSQEEALAPVFGRLEELEALPTEQMQQLEAHLRERLPRPIKRQRAPKEAKTPTPKTSAPRASAPQAGPAKRQHEPPTTSTQPSQPKALGPGLSLTAQGSQTSRIILALLLVGVLAFVLLKRLRPGKPKTPVGVVRLHVGQSQFFKKAIQLPLPRGERRGLSVVDYDGDGDLDVFVCAAAKARLYQNDKGTLLDVSQKTGLKATSCRCGVWADLDLDGDLDLFQSVVLRPPKLWLQETGNKGQRTFRDVSKRLPKLTSHNAEGAGWLDANTDGFPDILLTNGETGIRLFLSQRKGSRFRDISDTKGLGPKGIGVGNGGYMSVVDIDGDGRLDFLYNLGEGILTKSTEAGFQRLPYSHSGVRYRSSNNYKMGTAWADYDQDGDLDLFIPQPTTFQLLRNDGGFRFTDVTLEAGALSQPLRGIARTAAWGDVNNDGWPDLVVGYTNTTASLYLNKGDGTFVNQTEVSGLPALSPKRQTSALLFVDWDRDGDLDLVVNNHLGPALVLINEAKPSARVLLRVEVGTRAGPESQVVLKNQEGKTLAQRAVGSIQNQCAQSPYEVYFAVKPGQYTVQLQRNKTSLAQQMLQIDKHHKQTHPIKLTQKPLK